MKKKGFKRLVKRAVLFLLGSLLLSKVLPVPKFDASYSVQLNAKDGTLLAARIASDGQWRFPEKAIKERRYPKFEKCLLTFEDRYFHQHFGINPVSLMHAVQYNYKQDHKRRGGSTITMQLARMLSNGNSRTYWNKTKEMLVALHLEVNLSKQELLNSYINHAPFGGNVVGLEAAAWRYYGRSPKELSWAENALLAVLPNSPGLLYPGKGQELLTKKRNRLLDQLQELGEIDETTCRLSKLESIPVKPLPLPKNGQHALNSAIHTSKKERFLYESNLDFVLQNRTQQVVNEALKDLEANKVYNAAAIIVEVKTGKILSYVGNANTSVKHGNKVDVIRSLRSTGSVLKPFLYARALDNGNILPSSLMADVPTYYAGYSPKNYYLNFDGAVRANEALSRSLNVPFVRLLQEYRVELFYDHLKRLGMTSLNQPPDHYGLSLILGGAEISLFDLATMYAGMARVLNNFGENLSYSNSDYFPSMLIGDSIDNYSNNRSETTAPLLSAAAIYHTFQTLTAVRRPNSETGWKSFANSRKIAWKTGTSFGNKDAWAVGITPEYIVGVWTGNADGEGRTGLTGVNSAAPILFKLFDFLPKSSWFDPPYDELKEVVLCKQSGWIAGAFCNEHDTTQMLKTANSKLLCPYHRLLHLSPDLKHQLRKDCAPGQQLIHQPWFVLPPVQEWYFRQHSPLYQQQPPFHPSCKNNDHHPMTFAYPKNSNRVYIPKELDGTKGRVIFELVHRFSDSKVFWHLDGAYLGLTEGTHKMAIDALPGTHEIVVVDENGKEVVKSFEVLEFE